MVVARNARVLMLPVAHIHVEICKYNLNLSISYFINIKLKRKHAQNFPFITSSYCSNIIFLILINVVLKLKQAKYECHFLEPYSCTLKSTNELICVFTILTSCTHFAELFLFYVLVSTS